MTRLNDWRKRLSTYLWKVGRTPFAYGSNDCMLFVAGAVEAMTGEDHAADYRGTYDSLRGGLEVVRAAGFETWVDMAAAQLGEEIAPVFAIPGDVAVVETADGSAMGIFQGEMIYAMGTNVLGLVPRTDATRAFRV